MTFLLNISVNIYLLPPECQTSVWLRNIKTLNIQIRQRILHRNDTYALFSASSLVITVLSYTTIPFIYGFKQAESFCIAVMATSPLLLNKTVSYDHPILWEKL